MVEAAGVPSVGVQCRFRFAYWLVEVTEAVPDSQSWKLFQVGQEELLSVLGSRPDSNGHDFAGAVS